MYPTDQQRQLREIAERAFQERREEMVLAKLDVAIICGAIIAVTLIWVALN